MQQQRRPFIYDLCSSAAAVAERVVCGQKSRRGGRKSCINTVITINKELGPQSKTHTQIQSAAAHNRELL